MKFRLHRNGRFSPTNLLLAQIVLASNFFELASASLQDSSLQMALSLIGLDCECNGNRKRDKFWQFFRKRARFSVRKRQTRLISVAPTDRNIGTI